MKSIETTGKNFNAMELIKKIKLADKDGVLVLFNLNHPLSERYDRYAGISVGISVGTCVYIDAVGKGFDGREVSKGICSHERYFIPWFELRFLTIEKFKTYRTYLIDEKEYQKSRKERITFLQNIGLDFKKIEEKVPIHYREIPDFIWLDIIKNILKKVEKMEYEFESLKLMEFAISGHTEGKHFLPWQMFDKSRYF